MDNPSPNPNGPDPSPADAAHVASAYRPLVYSICRRYLRDPEDVQDAVQETFARYLRSAGTIRGSVSAWLTTTAYTTSVELIRRTLRERRRRERVAVVGTAQVEHHLLQEAIRLRLMDAIARLGDADRQLIRERFFAKTGLRVLAAARGVSVATASRQASRALEQLAGILREMGVTGADDLTLAEHFGDPIYSGAASGGAIERIDELRFAPDWRAADAFGIARVQSAPAPRLLPGWSRPVRVGAFVSYSSARVLGPTGLYHTIEEQVWTSQLILHPAFEMVGIVERGTTSFGPVERTLREYELTAGLVDASDVEGLKTCDVILFGINFALEPEVARAFETAVESGVGMLNEYWTNITDEHSHGGGKLMLATGGWFGHHEPPRCGTPIWATVREEHVLLPGLKAGDKLFVCGCGPVFRPTPGTRVCIEKDRIISSKEHGIPDLGEARMPVFNVGELGRGRVVWVGLWKQEPMLERLSVSPAEYIRNLLGWLAEPRRLA